MPTAARRRTPSVWDFPTFSVQGPRGHHQAALQPFSGGHRWGFVCLASAAVTGFGEGRLPDADFQKFSLQISSKIYKLRSILVKNTQIRNWLRSLRLIQSTHYNELQPLGGGRRSPCRFRFKQIHNGVSAPSHSMRHACPRRVRQCGSTSLHVQVAHCLSRWNNSEYPTL